MSGRSSQTSGPGDAFRRDEADRMEALLAQPLPAARADLRISPQLYLGRTVYVVKDPVGLSYYRLQPAERFVLKRLDGRASAKELAELVNARFPQQPTTPQDVLNFVKMLQGTGLILGRGESHGAWLRRVGRARSRRLAVAKWSNFLFIKIPVLDPDRVLDWLYSYLGLVMNRATMVLALAFMAVSGAAALFELQRVADLAFPLLGWQNLMLLSAVFLAVKVIHEFGHGLAAKHHGLEVHEMGVLLMVFFPLFYVDVSDAWMVPRRRDRMWITAGGVFIEFLFASVAVWVWLGTSAGVVNQIAFNVMLAASVTTLLFNANPLLRYDGYYFLMDWLQIPNLRAKATQYLGYLAKRYVLAMPDQHPPREAATHPIFMPVYAAAAGLYRWLIIFSIIALVWHILDPYGLEVIGSLLGTVALVTMVMLPLAKMLRFVWRQQARTWRRLAASVAGLTVLGVVAAGILAIPLEQSVEQPAVVLAEQRQPLYAAAAGRVERVFVEDGQWVEAGAAVVELVNEDLEEELQTLRVDRALAELELERARQEEQGALVQAVAARVKQLDARIDHVRGKIGELTVRTPIAGRIEARRRFSALRGLRLERGEPLGVVIGEGRRVDMIVPQDDASIVRAGMAARVRLWGAPERTLSGRVERVGSEFLRALPHNALAGAMGGEVDTKASERYNFVPATPSVVVRIALTETAAPLPDGMTGRGKIVIGRTRLGHQQWRSIRQALSLDWWL